MAVVAQVLVNLCSAVYSTSTACCCVLLGVHCVILNKVERRLVPAKVARVARLLLLVVDRAALLRVNGIGRALLFRRHWLVYLHERPGVEGEIRLLSAVGADEIGLHRLLEHVAQTYRVSGRLSRLEVGVEARPVLLSRCQAHALLGDQVLLRWVLCRETVIDPELGVLLLNYAGLC